MQKAFLLSIFSFWIVTESFAQTVPFPETRVYNQISPWGHTDKGTNWDTSPFIPFIYKEIWFRIMPPNGVTYDKQTDTWNFSDPSKEYPMSYFQVGGGKFGDDNNYPLANGGRNWRDAVLSDEFPGFVVYPQNMSRGGQPPNQSEDLIRALMDLLPVDRTRLYMHGTSNGGKSVWLTINAYPRLFAAATPFSGISESGYSPQLLFTPIRQYQGGNDLNPAPGYTESILNQFVANGGATEYVLYPTLGHGTWNRGYSEDDYFTWLLSHKMNDIHVLFDNREICPGDPINVTMGFTPGFTNYEWRKDGVLIAGENNNTLNVNQFGNYSGRILLEGEWTEWSDAVEIKLKDPTQTPPINVENGLSHVIPSPDGRSTVNLELPGGYSSYRWENASNAQVIGSNSTLNNVGPGEYRATVTEEGGCSSLYSETFVVVNANGPNAPEGVIALRTQVLSKTEVQLLWDQNPAPSHNETAFEVYRSDLSDGLFQLIGKAGVDASTFTDNGLNPGSEYYYLVRAINETSASDNSETVYALTELDEQPPSSPVSLTITSSSASSIGLDWSPSNDNIGVVGYDVYVDGAKSFTTQNTQFEVFGLAIGEIYTLAVKARDFAGNESAFSNQVVGITTFSGSPEAHLKLDNDYSDDSGNGVNSSGRNGPVFQDTVVKQGSHALYFGQNNEFVDLDTGNEFIHDEFSERTVALWINAISLNGIQDVFDEGGSTNGFGIRINNGNIEAGVQDGNDIYTISAPFTSGEWRHVAATFDNGSFKLFIDAQLVANQSGLDYDEVSAHSDGAGLGGTNGSNAFDVVNNNFEGYIDDLYIDNTALGVAELSSLIIIDDPEIPDTRPNAPTDLSASAISYQQIDLSWTDNSSDETGFQLFRSTAASGPYNAIGILTPNSTSYSDSGLIPETTYYYQVVALGEFGASEVTTNVAPSIWLDLDNNIVDKSPNNVVSQANNGPLYSNTEVQAGSHSAYFPGGNDYFDLDVNDNFIHDAFDQKSIAFWLRTNSTNGLQDIFDEGGSTNGIGMRINNGDLEFAVQNSHDIRSISAAITESSWVHITGVFDNGSLSLYLNGTLEASLSGIPYTTVSTHGNGAGLGATNSSNAFDVVSNNFNGWIDEFLIFDAALTGVDIASLMAGSSSSPVATTLPLPPVPSAPSALMSTDLATTSITLGWTEESANEDFYEVFKSVGDNSNYQLLDTTSASNYQDNSLFPHTTYFYQVRAVNVGGASDFSNEFEVLSLNSNPVPNEAIDDIFMHHDSERSISIVATDADNDAIFINPLNFPSFVDFFDEGDGTAGIFIDPEPGDVGVYQNLGVQFTDLYGGLTVVTFNLEILNNHPPVILPFSDVELFETNQTSITLEAEDQDMNPINWFFQNVPAFASVDTTAANQANFIFSPGADDEGSYAIGVRVEDGHGGFVEEILNVNVQNLESNFKVYVNFGRNSNATTPWNNFMVNTASNGSSLSSLVNDQGYVTNISATLETNWNGVQEVGGMPNGIYTDEVRESYFWTNSGQKNIRLSGLNPAFIYNLEFFGSRNKNGDRRTVYSVGQESVVLESSFNSNQTVTINGIEPDANGEIVFGVANINANGEFSVGYLNSLIIESVDDGGVPPLAPSALIADFQGGSIDLEWTDNSMNENGFEIYKSVGDTLSFTLLSTIDRDVTTFTDTQLSADEQHYRVRAFNLRGFSDYSDIASLGVVNLAPTIAGLDDINVQAGAVGNLVFTVSDPDEDSFTLQVIDLPSFATFSEAGDGGSFEFSPTLEHEGSYQIAVVAEDSLGNITNQTFELSVTHKVYETVLINFGANGGLVAPSPWNNVLGAPSAGKSVNNLSNTSSVNTGFDVTLVNSWAGGNTSGVVTGNNSGIYPDVVMQNYYADNSNNQKSIRLSDLDANRIYDVLFFASRANINEDRKTQYSIGGKSVTLNARNNGSEVVQINGVTPNGSGNIDITVRKATGSPWAYINAIELRYYDEPLLPGTPFGLTANGDSKSSINLSWVDNSGSESGFEIYRSTSLNGTFGLIGSVAANTEQYIDAGLQRNTVYYYKVKAFNANGTSLDSDVAYASTYNNIVYLNFGDENYIAPFPWNNTGEFPFVGNITQDLLDDEGFNTGIDMEIITNPGATTFAAAGSKGANTGNNSGVYPDVVMQSYYWIEQGEVASVKFSNLNLNQKYDLIFFASREATSRGTDFTVDSETVSLNGSFNSTQTVRIDEIVPDSNGEIFLDMESMNGTILGYVNAIVIQSSNATGGTQSSTREAADAPLDENTLSWTDKLKVYPNPFDTKLTVSISSEVTEAANIVVYDQTGRAVHEESYNMKEGINEIEVNTLELKSGVYLLKVLRDSSSARTLRLIK
ncbi:MAG: LamG-like jellyroll fold domain-containing protein, partial [Bacteroidota bacterium]